MEAVEVERHFANVRHRRLEKIVRDAVFKGEHDKIQTIVEQLCHDYAYAVHQPHARNGGLIGLAAASIALGSVSHRLQRKLKELGLIYMNLGRSRNISEGDRSSGSGMLLGPRCASPVLCL